MLKVIEKALSLKEIEELKYISADHLMQLAEACSKRTYKKGDTISQREDSPATIFLLLRGQATLEEDKTRVYEKAALNLCSSLAGAAHKISYICLEDCTVLEIAAADLIELLAGEPEFCLALLKYYAYECLQNNDA